MRQVWALCWFEILRVFKQRRSWIMMFAMPLLFSFIFGSFAGKSVDVKIPLAVSDEDHSPASQELVKSLTKNNLYTIQTLSPSDAQAQLQDKKVAGAILIPAGYMQQLEFGAKTDVNFQHGPDLTTAPMISQTLNNTMAQAAVEIQAAKSWSRASGDDNWQAEYQKMASAAQTPAVTVATKTVTKNAVTLEMNSNNQRTIGFSIMFVMFSLMSVTGKILEARKTGVWYRLLSTPVSRLQVLGGYLLSFFLTGWIQFAILMVLSKLLFHVEWGNWLGLVVLVSALLLTVVGLGLFIAGLVKTSEQQSAISSILIVSTCMLGGVYWPLDIVSDTMKKIAEFVPQFWAMNGFTELVARGGTVADIVPQTLVLLGFAAVFLFVGIFRVRYE